MAAPDRDELRRLAELRLDRPVVLSLYLDLDPSEFATPPARATATRSLLDDAERRVRDHGGLSHQDRSDLNAALERSRAFLRREIPTEGAHAVALLACEPADLFEVLRLPRSVPSRVTIGHSPLVAPLVRLERRERWCVALVSRRDARIFRGSPDGLREIDQVHDVVFGQHDQGGWSQARYQRGIEKEKDDHLKHTAEVLLRHYKRAPFQRLVVGGPREVAADFESKLHGYLQERLAGRVEGDVDTASAEQVLEAARPRFEELESGHEREALDRMEDGSRAAVGLDEALQALNQRRVGTLIVDERFSAPGVSCPECGWVATDGGSRCPADGTELARCDDVTDAAIELAVQQSAEVLPLRHHSGELSERGGVAALLRF
ncbi:MAG TPA: Vms1/Ankzf1 family peptidyl-tRNA hydrolase [Thermoleophilaceae bacterium]